MLKNAADRNGLISKLLHWLIALTIFGLIWEGWYMVGLSYYDEGQPRLLYLHKAFGMLVLFLALGKVLWHIYTPRPDLSAGMVPIQRLAALALQRLLLLLMLLVVVTGFLVATSSDAPIEMFGLFKVPVLIVVSDAIRDVCIKIHFYAAYGMLVLAMGHAGAAFWHQFVTKDDMLARMLWK